MNKQIIIRKIWIKNPVTVLIPVNLKLPLVSKTEITVLQTQITDINITDRPQIYCLVLVFQMN